MDSFVSKSLSKEHSDKDIKDGCHSISFISFNRSINAVLEEDGKKDKPIGYRVTKEGIELIWD